MQIDRAKQFMPFAALKGLPEALAKKEKQREEELEQEKSPYEDISEGDIIEN
jgi:hypothetical protein